MKALRSGNSELAQSLFARDKPYSVLERFNNYWIDANRILAFVKTCEASLWGDLKTLKRMKRQGLFLHHIARICAHFMNHWEIELYLKLHGCKLKRKSLYYKLAEACATNNIDDLKQSIVLWCLTGHDTLDDVIL